MPSRDGFVVDLGEAGVQTRAGARVSQKVQGDIDLVFGFSRNIGVVGVGQVVVELCYQVVADLLRVRPTYDGDAIALEYRR
jgi:hypothetical protein